MNRLHGVHVQVLAVLLVSVAGCVTLGGGRGGPDSVAGEWVDLHKSLAGDTASGCSPQMVTTNSFT